MKEEEISALINYRLAQSNTSLGDAKYLLDGNRSPQSVVNRAYYAMFYAALALMQKIEKVPARHTGVISLFDTEFVLKGALPLQLSKDFHAAFELRQVADYRVVEPLTIEKAEEMYERAVRFVDAITKYLLQT